MDDEKRVTGTGGPQKEAGLLARLGSFLRFSCASVVCVLIDQGLFALFQKWVFVGLGVTAAIWAATALARVLSSLCNYTINRHAVFHAQETRKGSLVRYYILCALQLLCSAGLVAGLHRLIAWDPSILKLGVDLILFCASYQIQKRWVFR